MEYNTRVFVKYVFIIPAIVAIFCMVWAQIDALATEPWQPSRLQLVKGINEVAMPGAVGSLCVFGPTAFPVVTGLSENSYRLPVIACAETGTGRMVACSHGGYVDIDFAESSTSNLMLRLSRWAANKDLEKSTEPLKVAYLRENGLSKSLVRLGNKAAKVEMKDLQKHAKFIDLLLLSNTDLQNEDVELVQQYISGGGGVIYADAAWVWEGYHQKAGQVLANDHPPTKLFAKHGIVWTHNFVDRDSAHGFTLKSEIPDEVHALSAIRRLAQKQKLPDKEANQVMRVLISGLQAIPRKDTLLLPHVIALERSVDKDELLSQLSSRDGVEETISKVAIARNTAVAQQLKPEETVSSKLAMHFPGSVPKSAERVSEAVHIDLSIPRWHCTGLYAPPGEILTVEIPLGVQNMGVSIRIGCHTDGLWHAKSWNRPPQVDRVFACDRATIKIANAFGGMVYVVVPGDKKKAASFNGKPLQGLETFKIDGAVRAPVFAAGRTSNDVWNSVIRNYPGPWAEIGSDKIIFTVPASFVRRLDRPDQVMQYWDAVMDLCAELAMISSNRTTPERFVIDTQISHGYMHAGYPIMAPMNFAKDVLELERVRVDGNWGVFHEIGHNHQEPEWTYEGMGEVTVNLFSLYVYDKLHPGKALPPEIAPDRIRKLKEEYDKNRHLEGAFELLMPYMELQRNFGWEPFKKVFAEYSQLPENERPRDDLEKRNQWLQRFSKAVGKNLTTFFDYWGMVTSQDAKDSVSSLPSWSYP